MKKMRQILCVALAMLTLCAFLPAPSMAAQFQPSDFAGSSWFGQYTGTYDGNPFEYYIDFTIASCGEDGAIAGSAKIRSVEGQKVTLWYTYDFAGNIDFAANTFAFHLAKETGHSSGIYVLQEQGIDCNIVLNANQEISLTGLYADSRMKDLPFSARRISAWARDEMTEANIAGLIPGSLSDADMSRRITRGEFAAVSVKLYETLTGQTAPAVSTPFVDIAGSANQADIEKAYGLNIVVGVSDTEFDPNAEINREQLATMLCRTVKKYAYPEWTIAADSQYQLDTSGVKTFADDASISAYAKPSVYYMNKMGIIQGMDGNRFAPKNLTSDQAAQGYATATREQAIVMSLRIYRQADAFKK